MNFYYYSKYNGKSTIEQLRRVTFFVSSSSFHIVYVVKNKETIEKLSKTSTYASCCASAPLTFVACYRINCRMPEYAHIDMSASVENLLLEADSLGLGAVWLGIAPLKERMDAVREVLNIPENLEAFAIIACGYPESVRPQQNRFDKDRIHYVL